jgi:signal transduction histidine kinase
MIVMAVDDDRHNLKALTRIFSDFDEYTLHCCESGSECLEKIKQLPPDLILLDIKMPGMNGYEVCQQIKATPKTSGIMVLLLSGKASLADRLQGYEVEADDYITKPFAEQELFAKVKILLRLKRAQDQLAAINSELSSLVDAKTREIVRNERQALVGQLVMGIVHNLRGPLTGAMGMAELARFNLNKVLERLNDTDKYYTALQLVHQNLVRSIAANDALADMITKILSKGRFDAQKGMQKIDLNALIEDEIGFLTADQYFKHKIEKKIDLDKDLPNIDGVPADFSQLCYNLIRNAIDAMQGRDKRVLSISTSCNDLNIYIRFQDTGCGLPPGHEKEIFAPFFTTKPSLEEAKEGEAVGTGLGLYTCLELVKLYNGTIKAESPEDGGSLFTVTLPRQQTLKE